MLIILTGNTKFGILGIVAVLLAGLLLLLPVKETRQSVRLSH